MAGLIGKKVGMTQVFSPNGELVPVTILRAGPCTVVQMKAKSTDGNDFSLDLELAQQGKSVEIVSKDADSSGKGSFDQGRLESKMTIGGHPVSVTAQVRERTLSGEWKQSDGDTRGTWLASCVDPAPNEDNSPAVVALYEYERKSGQRIYSTNPELKRSDMKRAAEPLCSVWRNPTAMLIVDFNAQAVPVSQR